MVDTSRMSQENTKMERHINFVTQRYINAIRLSFNVPAAALVEGRKAVEAMCGIMFIKEYNLDPGGLRLFELIDRLKKVFPAPILIPLGSIRNYGNKGAHPSEEDAEFTSGSIKPCLEALYVVFNWYFKEYLKLREDRIFTPAQTLTQMGEVNPESLGSRIFIADCPTVRSWGWTEQMQVKECMNLDYNTVQGLTQEHEGRMEQWTSIIRENEDTWRLLVNDSKEIIGYWHFVPLFDEEFENAKNGHLLDSDITVDKIPILLPGIYNIYFICINIKQMYQKTKAIQLMLDSLMNVLADFAEQEVFFEKVCAQAYTDSGTALCKSLGLKYHKKHFDSGDVYIQNVLDILERPYFKRNGMLLEQYKKIFGS